MHIRAKLIILSLGLSIIPLILVANVFLYNAQKELRQEVYGRLKAVSALKKEKLETFFASRQEDLRVVQGFLDVKIHLPTLQQFDRDRYNFAYMKAAGQLKDQFRAFAHSHQYSDILLLSTKGKTVFALDPARAAARMDKTMFSPDQLEKAKSGIYISDPVATGDGRYPKVLHMITAAYDIQQQFSGYIVMEVDMGMVDELINDNTGVGKTGETLLVKKMPERHEGILETIDQHGKPVLAVWQYIPALDWALVTKIDKKEALAAVTHTRHLLVVICIIALLIIVLSSFSFAQSISRPIYKAHDELRAMSAHDPLTGVLNRRGLQDVLSQTIAVSQRMGISVQVLLLDLDDFKKVNDTYGHGMGDAILVAVTRKIQETVRQSDYIARIGGDEFMVLLLDSREPEAIKVADKIRMAISQAYASLPSGETVRVTASIGVTPLGDDKPSIDSLLQKLHLALHLSKKEGKNRIAYQGTHGELELSGPHTASELKKVLVAGEKFYAASQPIFDLKDMSKTGYELLTRLDYDGYAAPDEFLLFARNADLLGVVDYACLRSCLRSLKGQPVTKRVYINIFPSTLTEIPTERLLQDFDSAGRNIDFCLEINEQQILGDPSYLIPAVMKLKKAGVMIALDDYGFGRSSIETLLLLEPDIVKIDKKIIRGIASQPGKLNSLKRLLKVIESCKASVVAEGIETDEDLKILLGLGVTLGQGFLMGKPETPPNLS